MDNGLAFQWYDIENDPHGWDRQVASVGQCVFHRNAMLAVHQSNRTFRRGVLITRDREPVALAGGLLRPGHSGGRFCTLSFPRLHDRLDPTLPRKLADWLLRQEMSGIELGSSGGGVEGYQTHPMGRISERLEFVYDLTRNEEERLGSVSAGHRRQLQRGERKALRLRRVDAGQAMLMVWLERRREKGLGKIYGLRRALESYRFYRRLTGHLSRDGCATLYALCGVKGRMLALAYMVEHAGSSFYMVGVASEEGDECGAAVRLLWELARGYPRLGVRTLNLGSVPCEARHERHKEHAIYRFKAGFGAEPVLRQSLTIKA